MNGVKENCETVKITVIKQEIPRAMIPRVNRKVTAKILNSLFQIQSSHTIFIHPGMWYYYVVFLQQKSLVGYRVLKRRSM